MTRVKLAMRRGMVGSSPVGTFMEVADTDIHRELPFKQLINHDQFRFELGFPVGGYDAVAQVDAGRTDGMVGHIRPDLYGADGISGLRS